MPRKVRLHREGDAKSRTAKGNGNNMQKCTASASETSMDSADSERQFQLELCWCVQRLESALADKHLDDKSKNESWKVLQVLKNNSQPVVRKRQLMRTHFGDYREKMRQEEKKHAIKAKQQIKFVEPPSAGNAEKSTFLRKSLFQTTGDDSFKFNFALDLNTESEEQSASHEIVKKESKMVSAVPFKFNFTNSQFRFNFNSDDAEAA